MSKYTVKDAAKDTGSSAKQASKAWHDARNAAAKEGGHGVPAGRHSQSSSGKGGGGRK